ncbi:PepSY domain-containing protein [Streptomyces buecherae]|uniref:PepSY domain-containing protein n=1 Tax=Streptomyces buecherae TaxID=2763006 RepID=A0A7H8NDF8_9ACTN|nr:PepSY domain-containing protein [Streptomyces buecherae]QKW52475.1 PepSY domain-containing protein [Streptomyces buecherae]
MKRNLAIAAAAAAVLIGGGTASAVALTHDGDDAPASPTRAQDDTDDADDTPDDRDARDDSDDRDAGDDGVASDADDSDGADDREDAAEGRALRGAKVTAQEAVDAALKARPGTVVAAELDADDGARALWDVDILGSDGHWYELTLDGDTGKVTHQERDDKDHSAASREALRGAKVSAADAARGALRTAPGTVTSVELGDGPRPSWEVDVLAKGDGDDERELDVDLTSGKATWQADDDADNAGAPDDAADADDRDDSDGPDGSDGPDDSDASDASDA